MGAWRPFRLESILAQIAELKRQNRRAEAIALIQNLPELEKSEVKERLRELNTSNDDEATRHAAERKELEGLL